MSHAAAGRRKYTVEEYLAFENRSEEKHEYRDGDILDRDGNVVDIDQPAPQMQGASENHIRIERNLSAVLWSALSGSSCENFGGNLRVKVDRTRYCYPDQTIGCVPMNFEKMDGVDALVNPKIVFEILSQSTESADRGEKFNRYRGIESLEEYLLISQEQAEVERFYRMPDGVWAIGGTVRGLQSVLMLRAAEVQVPLSRLYERVGLPQSV